MQAHAFILFFGDYFDFQHIFGSQSTITRIGRVLYLEHTFSQVKGAESSLNHFSAHLAR